MRNKILFTAIFSIALFSLQCTNSETISESGNDADSDGDTDADGDSDTDADSDGDSDSDTDTDDTDVCDEAEFNIEAVPVNLMILQDYSYSMVDEEVADPTNWSHTLPALDKILEDWADSLIYFGFDIFPNGDDFWGCGVEYEVVYDCGPKNETNISNYIHNNTPGGSSTPLYCGMANFLSDSYAPNFADPEASRYLLVISDGEDFCGEGCCTSFDIPPDPVCTATPDEFADLTDDLVDAGMKIIVVGFGSGVSPDQLNAIASHGGMEAPYNQYLHADDEETLNQAFAGIAESVIACIYNIGSPDASADPDDVNFYFDGEIVYYDQGCESDEPMTWQWLDEEHTQVEFCEEACDYLQSGKVKTITATWGCASVPPPV